MKPRSQYEQITAAREILGIAESASMAEIRQRYRRLISRWHPDVCSEEEPTCQKMAARINQAYEIIRAYCDQYEYSFSREQVARNASPAEWWDSRFGRAPMWGQGTEGEK